MPFTKFYCNCDVTMWPLEPCRPFVVSDPTLQLASVEELHQAGWVRMGCIETDHHKMGGQAVYDCQLHVTERLLLIGEFVVVGRVQVDGGFGLKGTLALWYGVLEARELFIKDTAVIDGDVFITEKAYITGNCTITGKLKVTGELKVRGQLKCREIEVTGTVVQEATPALIEFDKHFVVNQVDESQTRRFGL